MGEIKGSKMNLKDLNYNTKNLKQTKIKINNESKA